MNVKRAPAARLSGAALLVLSLASALAAGACGSEPPASAADAHPADLSARVTFAPVGEAVDETVATLLGEVVLPAGAVQRFGPPVHGRVSRLLVAVGDTVAEGAPLAELTSLEVGDLEAQARELEAVLRSRSRLLAQRRPHVAEGLAPVTEVQEQEAAVAEARARLAAVKAQLDARRALGAGEAAGFVWASPVAGVVNEVHCAVGATVGPETTCFAVLDTARAELRVRVPERVLGRLEGVEPRVRFIPASAGGHDGAAHDLRLARKDATIASPSRTRAFWFVPGDGAPAGGWFVPGATGRAALVVRPTTPLLRVPSAAVTGYDGGEAVFVKEAGDTERPGHPVAVTVVGRDGDGLLVHGEGLTAGAEVAVSGVFLLKSVWTLGDGDYEAGGHSH
ncbi:MAG: efflux RND transporter periplasmic adaptor subunit [Deltaproteobacteria bacterium]|nr:efflux RND transporter periplasmic adaptor subunit [Deltaproteobacteria bacterium]